MCNYNIDNEWMTIVLDRSGQVCYCRYSSSFSPESSSMNRMASIVRSTTSCAADRFPV